MFVLQVRGAMEIALFIQNIQEERAEVWVWPKKYQQQKILIFFSQKKYICQKISKDLWNNNIQVALYIFTNQSDSNMTEVKYNENRFVIISSRYLNAMNMILPKTDLVLRQHQQFWVWTGNFLEQYQTWTWWRAT